jgi:hypothetical protein
VTPNVVRQFFKTTKTRKHASIDMDANQKDGNPHEIIAQKKNAAFLMTYCIADIPPASLDELLGLYLLPTDGGFRHVTLGHPTDPPLFLATDMQRRLLFQSGEVLI